MNGALLAAAIVAGVVLTVHLIAWVCDEGDSNDTAYFRAFWKIILFGK